MSFLFPHKANLKSLFLVQIEGQKDGHLGGCNPFCPLYGNNMENTGGKVFKSHPIQMVASCLSIISNLY